MTYGTQKETTARSMVAVRVTTKPGVAGRRQLIGSDVGSKGKIQRVNQNNGNGFI